MKAPCLPDGTLGSVQRLGMGDQLLVFAYFKSHDLDRRLVVVDTNYGLAYRTVSGKLFLPLGLARDPLIAAGSLEAIIDDLRARVHAMGRAPHN